MDVSLEPLLKLQCGVFILNNDLNQYGSPVWYQYGFSVWYQYGSPVWYQYGTPELDQEKKVLHYFMVPVWLASLVPVWLASMDPVWLPELDQKKKCCTISWYQYGTPDLDQKICQYRASVGPE